MRFLLILCAASLVACGGGTIFTAPDDAAPEAETVIDPCDPNPCVNGTCADGVCTCKKGFTGPKCADNIDDCEPNPCKNGGACSDGIASFTCTCPSGWTGPTCEVNPDDCNPNPCFNGGTCADGVADYTCTCKPGFTGKRCESNIDDCTPNPCKNGGTCTDTIAGFTCACPKGWTGPTCETNIDDCAPNPCKNGGTCTDGVDSFTCTCPAGFTGTLCETNINDCSPNPCKNGGTCTDGVASYTCACPTGWTGPTCETNIDDCAPNPCKNGGTCADGVASFTCSCATGWSGATCETNIDDCAPNPCKNGGICTDGIASFTCTCIGKRWTGTTCETDNCVSGVLATGTAGPSCSGLAATCGSSESCCKSVLIPGNAVGSRCEGETFFRDYDAATDLYETKFAPAQVSDHYVDKFDVTIGRYKQFLAAYDAWRAAGHPTVGEGAHPKITSSGWVATWPLALDAATMKTQLNTGTWYTSWIPDETSTARDLRGINSQTWYEAFAFCLWDGGRLPTEAEMLYGSMGGSEQRAYPWSSPASSTLITNAHASYACMGDGIAGCSNADYPNVGSFPLGDARWGQADLVGGSWEWVFDQFTGSGYPANSTGGLCINCADLTVATSRHIRGGYQAAPASGLRNVPRGFQQATSRDGHSFRCAYDLK